MINSLLFLFLASSSSWANLTSVDLKLNSNGEVKYYNFTPPEMGPQQFPSNVLYQIKKAYLNKAANKCLDLIVKHKKSLPKLQGWMINQQILCGSIQDFKAVNNKVRHRKIFSIAAQHMPQESYKKIFNKNLIIAGLTVFSHLVSGNKARAWYVFSELEKRKHLMSKQQKAEFFELAAERSKVDGQLQQTKVYYSRSLNEFHTPAVLTKLSLLQESRVKTYNN